MKYVPMFLALAMLFSCGQGYTVSPTMAQDYTIRSARIDDWKVVKFLMAFYKSQGVEYEQFIGLLADKHGVVVMCSGNTMVVIDNEKWNATRASVAESMGEPT